MELILTLKASGHSHTGLERKNNEDRFHCDPERGIFIVVDGVGGQAAGEKAADIALARIRTRLERKTGTVSERVREAITVANNEIFRLSKNNADWRGMACVLTLAVVNDNSVTVGHVGDSRLYKIHDGKIRKITHDHSPVGELEESGALSETAAMRHPRRNEVYRVVGAMPQEPDDQGFIEIAQVPFEPDSALLLCTDGLSDLVSSSKMLEVISRHAGEPDRCARELIRLANAAGGKDNVSAIVVEGEKFASTQQSHATLGGAPPAEAESNSDPRTVIQLLGSRGLIFMYGTLAGVLLMTLLQFYFDYRRSREIWPDQRQHKLVVDPAGGLASISRALDQAQAGYVIEVAPGEYAEQVRMKEGVSLVSQRPHEAVLKPADSAQDKILVVAQGIRTGRISGFKIQGDGTNGPSVGISIMDSGVLVDDIEVIGTTTGVLIGGKSAAILRANYIHDNTGTGIIIQGDAAPRLTHNLILANGKQGKKKQPGISILERADPVLERNIVTDNGAEPILNRSSASQKQKLQNNFLYPPPAAGKPDGKRKGP